MYTPEIIDYIKLRLETTQNQTQLAKEVVIKFGLNKDPNAVRKKIQDIITNTSVISYLKPIKRLFFDIETSYLEARIWRVGKVNWINASQIKTDKKIICISYKWWKDDKVHTLKWDSKQSDKKMLKDF